VKPIRVLLVDDHTLFRAGIRSLLEGVTGVTVVAEAGTGREALRLTKTTRLDVILMDITMKDLNGLEATASIVQEHSQARVLMLSMHDNEQYVIQALRTGARGYLLKDAATAELEQAITAVARGETYLSQAVVKHVSADYRRRAKGRAGEKEAETTSGASLTSRQREILQLIAEGHTTKEIAARLHLSANTVETHRRQMMKRLGVRSLAGLVRSAIRLGVVPPDC
jgi:DNA-binding NarL/FixJ family response regulator